MKISQWPRGRILILGCASAAVACAAVAGGMAFAWARQNTDAGAEAAGKTEYLTTIAPVAEPSSQPAASGKVCKQAVEAVQRNVTVRLTGSLAADDKSDVGSNASGIVSRTCVERGSVVKKGDLLVQLDPRDAQYALEEGDTGRGATARAAGAGGGEEVPRGRRSRGRGGETGHAAGRKEPPAGGKPQEAKRHCPERRRPDGDGVSLGRRSGTSWPCCRRGNCIRAIGPPWRTS